jgi:hypothetical protein
MWLARAMNLRDFFQSLVLRKVETRLPATVLATGNVATYWWQSEEGLAAWVINHEYSEFQNVRLNFKFPADGVQAEVYFGRLINEEKTSDHLSIEVEVAPASMASVILKN